MIEGIGRYTSRIFSKKPAPGKQDYKAKLWNTPVCGDRDVDESHQRVCPHADQIRHLVGHVQAGVAFQSLAVASLQTLRSVIAKEQQAAAASISLAQGEKLEEMIQTAKSTGEAIMETLDPQGSHMLNLSTAEAHDKGEASWWYALTDAIETIEDGMTRIISLASGQPKGAAGRKLCVIIVRLLRQQHHQLLAEADAWIS